MLFLLGLTTAGAVEQTTFDVIQGAKRWDRVNKLWELAVGNPQPLFPDDNILIREFDELKIGSKETRLLQLPYWPRTDAEFTCVVEIEAKGSGMLTMTHRNQRNSIVDQWDENFKGSGLVVFNCIWPYVVMDEKEKYESRFSLSSSRPVEVKKLYIYQTMRQIFRLDSQNPFRGIMFNRPAPANSEILDSISMTRLSEQTVPLITSSGGGLGYGLPMPVFAQNGCGVMWRMFGDVSIIVNANAEASEGKLHRRSFEVGRKGEWKQGFFAMETAWLNRLDADGYWVGSMGEKQNLLASIRGGSGGDSLLDYVVFIPQNRINLPKGHKYKNMQFRFQGTNGLFQRASFEVPPESEAVAMVNRNPGIQILWLIKNEWQLGNVLRVYLDSSLVVRENSIVFIE